MNAKNSNVQCLGSDSCQNSIVRGSFLHFGGSRSGYSSTLYADHIQGFGYKSLEFAVIDSAHRTNLLVESFGYFAGNNAIMVCRNGSFCELTCESNGCFKMEMICLEGAECAISPSQCMEVDHNEGDDEGASNEIVNGIDCPIYKASVSEREDEVLIKSMKNKEKYQKQLMKLQQHNEAKQRQQLQQQQQQKQQTNMVFGKNEIKIYKNRNNAEYVNMVMENEVIPRQYHRIWLYVAVIVSIVFMCLIPICFYIHYKLFEEDQNEDDLSYDDLRAVKRLLVANKRCEVY